MLELVQSFLSSYKPNSKENEHSAEDSDDEMDDDELEFNLDQTITVLLQLLSAIISENDIILDDKGSSCCRVSKILSTNSQFQASSLKGSADALCQELKVYYLTIMRYFLLTNLKPRNKFCSGP